jgi:transposase
LIVEHQAGIPVLMTPLRGHSRDGQDCGPLIAAHVAQVQIPYGSTVLVADSALDSADNLRQRAEPRTTWITRVPATLRDAQTVVAQDDPQTMAPMTEEYRYQVLPSTYGGVEQRWVRLHSEPRQPQAQRTVDKQLRKDSTQAVKAFKKRCRTAFACAAAAQPALATFAQDLLATFLVTSTVRPMPR